jgi:hypothetical protein
MAVMLKFETEGVAVYHNGKRIREGLSPQEADTVLRELLNQELARAHI